MRTPSPVHPNDHVDRGQSSNRHVPTPYTCDRLQLRDMYPRVRQLRNT